LSPSGPKPKVLLRRLCDQSRVINPGLERCRNVEVVDWDGDDDLLGGESLGDKFGLETSCLPLARRRVSSRLRV
jgi:hypothetical protein